jgi:hypothetical protein
MDAVYSRDILDPTIEAMRVRHLATHKPKLRSFDTCRRAKAMRARHLRANKKTQKRARKIQDVKPEKFGDRVTLDHIVARNERSRGYGEQSNAFTLIDAATDFHCEKAVRYKTGVGN